MTFRPRPPMGRGRLGPPQGYSIHVGVGTVDSRSYGGWSGDLQQCGHDAARMASLARAAGFLGANVVVLQDENARTTDLARELDRMSRRCHDGDFLLLTFSGHGGQLPDLDRTEIDDRDETWVLYDRMLLDDEIRQELTKFEAGVRVLVIADSCHSGTSADRGLYGWRPKEVDSAAAARQLRRDGKWFDCLRRANANATPSADVLLLSACRDDQIAFENDAGGLLTQALVAVWDNGGFAGDYNAFHDAIVNRVQSLLTDTTLEQTPGLLSMRPGDPLTTFTGQKPFTVSPPAEATAEPSPGRIATNVGGRGVTVTVTVPID